MAKILLTGGAGYIGSHVNLMLANNRHQTVVYDNLSTGFEELVVRGKLVKGDILDIEKLENVIKRENIDLVVHLAAKSLVGESFEKASTYWRNNVCGTRNLLDSMANNNVKNIVFSSTAAVYGEPEEIPIKENNLKMPINPYGNTKIAIEWMIEDEAKARGLKYGIFRYFNAAGADTSGEVGLMVERDPHLIPVCLDCAIGVRDEVYIFGRDYPTGDGTCVRDYIHVEDIADAHLKAVNYLLGGENSFRLNLGSGSGISVNNIIEQVETTIGRKLKVIDSEKREGDPAVLVADPAKAAKILGWKSRNSDIETIVSTAWKWHQKAFT